MAGSTLTPHCVTASSGTAKSTDFATRHVQKFCQNLTWHSNMLKMMYLPEKHPRKSEIAAREERTQETTEKTSIQSVKHGIVPIPGRLTLL